MIFLISSFTLAILSSQSTMQILQTKNEDKELETKTHFCNIREQQQVQDMKDADVEITNCKSLPFFYFLTFEKGRLLYIHPVGRSVGWSVGWSVG